MRYGQRIPNKMAIGMQVQLQQQYYRYRSFIPINSANRKFLYPIHCVTEQSNPDDAPAAAAQFAPLASTFRRRLLTGVASASLVALGANFAGLTSFLLGFTPDTARSLKLDVIYPIRGFIRCKYEEYQGFEFVYPANWVGDQTLLKRAAGKLERYLGSSPGEGRRRNISEPIVAFGPPGSTGELNVSVIVSPVALDFSVEAFGGPKEVGEALIKTIAGKRADVKGTLIKTSSREDSQKKNVRYYSLEFQVESPTFHRHNVAVFCATGGRLFTLNAQAPESLWPNINQHMYTIADSFVLT